jgi:uncharacterized membrane protein
VFSSFTCQIEFAMLEVSAYSLILFVHVLAGVALIGSGLFAPLAWRRMREAPSIAELRLWLEFSQRASKWNPAAAIVLLASGIYLGTLGWWSQAWFFVALAAWVINAALAGAVVGRAAGALGAAAARAGDGAVPAAVDAMRRARTWPLAHGALLANDLAILYVMFNKPELGGSVAVLVAANVIAAAAVLVRYRASAPHDADVEPGMPAGVGLA